MKLKDQVAIVTGGGRNIGEETAKLFAAEGARVAILDMDKARGEKVARRFAPPVETLPLSWWMCRRAAMWSVGWPTSPNALAASIS